MGGGPWLFYKHFIENDECMKQKDIVFIRTVPEYFTILGFFLGIHF